MPQVQRIADFLTDLQQIDRSSIDSQASRIVEAFTRHTPFDIGALYLRHEGDREVRVEAVAALHELGYATIAAVYLVAMTNAVCRASFDCPSIGATRRVWRGPHPTRAPEIVRWCRGRSCSRSDPRRAQGQLVTEPRRNNA